MNGIDGVEFWGGGIVPECVVDCWIERFGGFVVNGLIVFVYD